MICEKCWGPQPAPPSALAGVRYRIRDASREIDAATAQLAELTDVERDEIGAYNIEIALDLFDEARHVLARTLGYLVR